MKQIKLVLASVVVAACSISNASAEGAFSAMSADLTVGRPIPNKFVFKGFGCNGDNVSPEISWSNAPAGTKSFAVMVHDPDAPTGGAGFWHWVVVDVPATTTRLPQGAGLKEGSALPAGSKQINTDFGAPGWGGPCPPVYPKNLSKQHRYQFTVYALKVEKLELPANPTASLAGFMVNMNSLGKASFSARYGRRS
jgi:Raf kinase inhibitor-like YbhB/YbcL family protein